MEPTNPDEALIPPSPNMGPRHVKYSKLTKQEKRLRSASGSLGESLGGDSGSLTNAKYNDIGNESSSAGSSFSAPPIPSPGREGSILPALTPTSSYSSPAMTYYPSSQPYIPTYPSPSPQPQSASKTQYLASFNQKCAQQHLNVEYIAENQGLPHAPNWVVNCVGMFVRL